MNENINPAGFGKRLVAFLIDAAMVLIFSFVMWNVSNSYILPSWGVNETLQEMYSFADDSGLFVMSKDPETGRYTSMSTYGYGATTTSYMSASSSVNQEDPGYAYFLPITFDSWTTFFHDDSRVMDPTILRDGKEISLTKEEYYTGLNYGIDMLGLPDPSNLSAADIVVEKNLLSTSGRWKWDVRDGDTKVDTSRMPVLSEATKEKVAAKDSITLTSLFGDFIAKDGNSYTGAYYKMENSLQTEEPYFASRYKTYAFMLYESFCMFYFPALLIIFFIIPLFGKNAETLGKRIMGLAVVTSDGYSIKWWPGRILHPFLITLIGSSIAIIPWTILGPAVSIMMFTLLCLIDYMGSVLSKKKRQSFTDRLSRTMVIDAKTSTWFASKEAEEEYKESHSSTKVVSSFFDAPITPEENAHVAAIDSILDLSTIDRHRKEAEAITSFDEFEAKGVDTSNKKESEEDKS